MATIAEHVGALRGLVAQHTDDSKYTDQLIYHYFNIAANRLQIEKALSWQWISTWNRRRHCLELEIVKSHNCDCVPVGCDVLRTVYNVPRPLVSRNRDLIKVFDLQNREIFRVTEQEQISNQFDPVKKNKITYSLIDQKIVLWNAIINGRPKYKAIEVEMIAEDETQWANITYCDKDGNDTGESCFDIDANDYSLDGELVHPAYQLALQMLGINAPLDNTNDANQDIKI